MILLCCHLIVPHTIYIHSDILPNLKVTWEIRDEGQTLRPWAFLEIAVKCIMLRSSIKRHPGNYVAVRELNLQ